MSTNNYTSLDYKSQVQKVLEKCMIKKSYNKSVIEWLYQHDQFEYAYNVEDCATVIGFTNIANVAHVTKANFCRRRLCSVCAWRRQTKFTAQTFPVIKILQEQGYRFIFASLTVPNVPLDRLTATIDRMLNAYDLLLKRRKVKRSWVGKIRALEVTYNSKRDDFHPHIHILIAVKEEYFTNSDLYITVDELREYWTDSLRSDFDYPLDVFLKAVDNDEGAVVETIKYSFKGAKDSTAIEGFFRSLGGRRLVSFSGVFAKVRKQLKYSDFENVLTDDVPEVPKNNITYQLYKFDITGGVYNYWKELEYYGKI